jgi:hypothetical protein
MVVVIILPVGALVLLPWWIWATLKGLAHTVKGLTTAYTVEMQGRTVRVRGPVESVGPVQPGQGSFLILYTPGKQLRVGAWTSDPKAPALRRDEIVTVTGVVEDRVTLHADEGPPDEALPYLGEVVRLRGARLER